MNGGIPHQAIMFPLNGHTDTRLHSSTRLLSVCLEINTKVQLLLIFDDDDYLNFRKFLILIWRLKRF